jgi:hypothetical protein
MSIMLILRLRLRYHETLRSPTDRGSGLRDGRDSIALWYYDRRSIRRMTMPEVRTVAGGIPVPSPTLVQADQTSILGDGSHERPLHAGVGHTEVVADQVTILGNGTAGSPLHTPTSSTSTFTAAFTPSTAVIGQAVSVFIGAGPMAVTPTSHDTSRESAVAVGVITIPGFTVTVQFSGIVTLTTAEWDIVINGGSPGGLVAGSPYYVAAPGHTATPGEITATRTSTPGDYATQIGVALSSTQLLLSTPSVPELIP